MAEEGDRRATESEIDNDESLPPPFSEIFDINEGLKALAHDSPELAAKLDDDENELSSMRARIVITSRRNFILDRELAELDEKIKLLVKNRITVHEVQASLRNSDQDEKDVAHSPLSGRKDIYEDLFFLLQSKTHYLARLSRLVETNIAQFVQTVVIDMYGDQFNSHEERLLLDLFKRALTAELQAAEDKGSLLRNNNAITQMLSTYAKRGAGSSIIKGILGGPIHALFAVKNLDLEIDPYKVYQQIRDDYEVKTGKLSDLPKEVDATTAAQNPEVQRIISDRARQLTMHADAILQSIFTNVDKIPYGMRWICKTLGTLMKNRWPSATRKDAGRLIGGYIFLRFFNPSIINPLNANLSTQKPSKTQMRALTLISKMIQNLSNLSFEDKEPYMKVVSSFVSDRIDAIMDYFDHLAAVDDLQDHLQVDKYMQHIFHSNVVMNINQIVFMHELLVKHQERIITQMGDPLTSLLKRLKDVPKQVKPEEDYKVHLTLIDHRKQRISTTADAFATRTDPMYHQVKVLLLRVLGLLPSHSDHSDLIPFLEAQQLDAQQRNDEVMAQHVADVKSMLEMMAEKGMLKTMETDTDTINHVLWDVCQDAMQRTQRLDVVKKRLKLVAEAEKAISGHSAYLEQRLDLYKLYLENARRGGASEQAQKSFKVEKKVKLEIPHQELLSTGVILRVDPIVPAAIMQKAVYHITMVSPGKFEIDVHLKKGIDIKVLKKPVVVVLDELLSKQEHGETKLTVESIDLSVNLLLHLLNTKFVAKS